MTRYDVARMCGYNSVEEYDEAEKRYNEIFFECLKNQKPYVEKEPVKMQEYTRDAVIDALLEDVVPLARYHWYRSNDIGSEDYLKKVKNFKEKWLRGNSQKRGKWIDNRCLRLDGFNAYFQQAKCPECGRYNYSLDANTIGVLCNEYCSHCGVRMDGDTND